MGVDSVDSRAPRPAGTIAWAYAGEHDPVLHRARPEVEPAHLDGVERSPRRSVWGPGRPPDAPAPGAGEVKSGFGKDVDRVVKESPLLARHLRQLEKDGWTIRYSMGIEKGTFTDSSRHEVVIDPRKETGRDVGPLVEALAHEVGHAEHKDQPPVGATGLTRQQYIDRNVALDLNGEGAATFENCAVRAEILEHRGPDVGVAGAQSATYQRIYAEYQAGKLSQQQAERRMGALYGAGERTSNTHDLYKDYYGKRYAEQWDSGRAK
jgi:type VI secretion system secreted protein VgrG